MATEKDVAAALADAQQLQAEWQGCLETATGLMASDTWLGTGALQFGQWLAGLNRSFKGDLAGLTEDLQKQKAAAGQTSASPTGTVSPDTPVAVRVAR